MIPFAIIEAGTELWLEHRPLKNWHPFRKIRNRRRERLGLPPLTDDPPTQELPTMPTGTVTKTSLAVMMLAAVLTPLLMKFGVPNASDVAVSVAASGLTIGAGLVAWWGKNRGLKREALLKQAVIDLLGHEGAAAVQKGATVSELVGPVGVGNVGNGAGITTQPPQGP